MRTGEEMRKGGRGNKERIRRGDSVTAEQSIRWVEEEGSGGSEA